MSEYPKLTLEYFPLPGRGEPIRAMCWMNDIPLEDIQLTFPEFAAKKSTLPLGQVPILHVDGKLFPQSNALYRYVGRLSNTYPTDPLEALKVDVVTETVEEMMSVIGKTFLLPPEECEAGRKKLIEDKFPAIFKFIQDKIAEDDTPFIANGKLSIADILLYCSVYEWIKSDTLPHLPSSCLEPYPEFVKYCEGLKETEQIKKYLQVRETKKAQ